MESKLAFLESVNGYTGDTGDDTKLGDLLL